MSSLKADLLLGLSAADVKLLVLGVAFQAEGKVDYEKVAKYGGYTKGSAATMYRNAYKKLMANAGSDNSAADGLTTSKSSPSKKPAGKKRKLNETSVGSPVGKGNSNEKKTATPKARGNISPRKPQRGDARKLPVQKAASSSPTVDINTIEKAEKEEVKLEHLSDLDMLPEDSSDDEVSLVEGKLKKER